MRQIAATHRGDKSPRLHCCCDKAACAYFRDLKKQDAHRACLSRRLTGVFECWRCVQNVSINHSCVEKNVVIFSCIFKIYIFQSHR